MTAEWPWLSCPAREQSPQAQQVTANTNEAANTQSPSLAHSTKLAETPLIRIFLLDHRAVPGWFLVEETLESGVSIHVFLQGALFQTTSFLDCGILNKNLFGAYHRHKMLFLLSEIQTQFFFFVFRTYFCVYVCVFLCSWDDILVWDYCYCFSILIIISTPYRM